VRDFGIPVLYLRAKDGNIIAPRSDTQSKEDTPIKILKAALENPDNVSQGFTNTTGISPSRTTVSSWEQNLPILRAMSKEFNLAAKRVEDTAKRERITLEIREILDLRDLVQIRESLSKRVIDSEVEGDEEIAYICMAMLNAKPAKEGLL
jgi:hypothetical protein